MVWAQVAKNNQAQNCLLFVFILSCSNNDTLKTPCEIACKLTISSGELKSSCRTARTEFWYNVSRYHASQTVENTWCSKSLGRLLCEWWTLFVGVFDNYRWSLFLIMKIKCCVGKDLEIIEYLSNFQVFNCLRGL